MKPGACAHRTLDALGLKCPEPVFRVRQCLAEMDAGEVLEVRADDPLAELDLAVFCDRTGHEMLSRARADGRWTFLLRKTGVLAPDP